ncbi:MBL fold metallo-hydrolase [Stappia sp.]|uniref:MBL fold metallo-hydrolase n=1 Tax=Stappia sp. TaxID=1870903 RepID=UPI0032D8EC47
MTQLRHDRDFDPAHGRAVTVSDAVRRITAPNAGPFTWHGTNTYLVGRDAVAVIDPGPTDPDHIALILEAAGPAPVEAILVSHTHVDHSPGARLLQQRTGAPIVGCGAHRAARPLFDGEVNPLDASGDADHAPDRELREGDTVTVDGLTLTAVETPGHTANHLAFALDEGEVLFSADHVMAWSTSIVAPPDGAMGAYMASLEKLAARDEATYLPGHGGPVRHAQDYVAALKDHRLAREKAVLDRLAAGDTTIPQMVSTIYAAVDPALHGAAALSVLAQIEWLVERGLVEADAAPSLSARYRLA